MKREFKKRLDLAQKKATRYVYEDNGTVWINWPLVPAMKHLDAETLESAKITARISGAYLTRRSGEIPREIQELINSPHATII